MKKYYLVYSRTDGWVVHETKKKALADFKSIQSDDDPKLLEVVEFKEEYKH